MDEKTVKLIEDVLRRGDKIELQPAKNGVIINAIKRKNIGFIKSNIDPD